VDYTKAIELDPNCRTAYSNLGGAKIVLGDYQGAIGDCTKAIELDPKNASTYRSRGIAKVVLGDDQGGILDLRKAGELGDKSAWDLIKKVQSKLR
jgi:Flp pilus assembly protein TadD